jgi:sugar phosphate isomerase/epimerase
LGVLVDFFHANIEDTSICGALRMAGSKLMNVHVSDSNREAPGTGHIDFIEVIRTLDEIGYQGFLSIGFVPSRLNVELLRETLLESSVNYLNQLERVVAVQKRTYQEV